LNIEWEVEFISLLSFFFFLLISSLAHLGGDQEASLD